MKAAFEARLLEAPAGGRWRFANPARCVHCGAKILGPMTKTPSYLVYEGSVVLDDWRNGRGIAAVLKPECEAPAGA